jgi:hypothetical protein
LQSYMKTFTLSRLNTLNGAHQSAAMHLPCMELRRVVNPARLVLALPQCFLYWDTYGAASLRNLTGSFLSSPSETECAWPPHEPDTGAETVRPGEPL